VRAASDFALRVQPDDPALRQAVLNYLKANSYQCEDSCVALDQGPLPNGERKVVLVQNSGFTELVLTTSGAAQELGPGAKALGTTLKPDSKVEVRTVSKRYVFVDGEPMAEPLDD
jgi:hypothetical protein